MKGMNRTPCVSNPRAVFATMRRSRRQAGLPALAPPAAARATVRNPLTRRQVQVDGRLYRRLLADVVEVPVEGDPVIRFGLYFTITLVYDPSTGVLTPRNLVLPLNQDLRADFVRVINGEAWRTVFLDLFGRRNLDEFYARNAAQIEVGVYTIDIARDRRAVDVDRGNRAQVEQYLQQVLDVNNMRVAADEPLRLPFSNVHMNTGTDGQCVARFLGIESLPESRRNLVGLEMYARHNGIPVVLYDVRGGVMHDWSDIAPDCAPVRGMLYNEHVYKVGGDGPIPVTSPKTTMESQTRIADLAAEWGAVVLRHNEVWMLPAGVYRTSPDVYEDWMNDVIYKMPYSDGFDLDTMWKVKRTALALYLHTGETLDPATHVAIDARHCYYYVLLDLCNTCNIPFPCLTDRWRRWNNDLRLNDCAYYQVREDFSYLGLMSNVLPAMTIKLLRANDIVVTVEAYLQMRHMPNTGNVAKALERLSMNQRKQCSLIVGMCGRISRTDTWDLEVHCEADRAYYARRYAMYTNDDNPMLARSEHVVHETINRLGWYTHVVHMANHKTLDMLFRIKRTTGAMPVRICVDSLTYKRTAVCTPFDICGEEGRTRLDHFCEDGFWHSETVRDIPSVERLPLILCTPHQTRISSPYEFNAITYNGAPGTGKTYSAMQLGPDARVTTTNKGARRINGTTIHALFNSRASSLWMFKPDMSKLESVDTLFVDEAQAVTRHMLAAVQQAQLQYPRLRVLFALDTDQLAPINEDPIPIMEMHGDVHVLTRNWRNDPGIVQLRERVKAGDIDGLSILTEPIDLITNFTECNVAFTNATCASVNRAVAAYLGIDYLNTIGSKVIVTKERKLLKELGLQHNDVLVAIGGDYFRNIDTDIEVEIPPSMQNRVLDWAYCLTVHRTIGEGYDELTVWDCERMDRRLLYTAVCRARSISRLFLRASPNHV